VEPWECKQGDQEREAGIRVALKKGCNVTVPMERAIMLNLYKIILYAFFIPPGRKAGVL
jgi:hypothetical protein